MVKQPKAVIIGAGFGGLATANLLAKAGWSVEVFESRKQLGGKLGLLKVDGFRFDTGPSWYLMPEVYEHYFDLLDEKVEDYINLKRLDPSYKVFYDYAKPITVPANLKVIKQSFAKIEPNADRALTNYLRSSKLTYQLAMRYFLFNPFTSIRTLIQATVLRHSWKLTSLLRQSLHGYVSKSFQDLRLQQMLEYPAVFLGSSPFKVPAMYHLMSHLDLEQGVYYPQGGMYELVKAMHSIGNKLGVQYHLNAPVSQIEVVAGRATGVHVLNGTFIAADIVISNADLHLTETKLLPIAAQTYPEARWQKKTSGPSALLMYLGIKGSLPQLEHHNLLFVKDWQQNFADIYDAKAWPTKPSIYVCKPTATDSSVAPKDMENVFVLVPLPAGNYKATKDVEDYAEKCLELIAEECSIPDLKQRIATKRLYSPSDFEADLGSWQGSALGLGHTLFQSAFFRPANKSKKVTNLYYVGGDVQPGVGLPMCLISAEVVYKRLVGDRSAGPLESLRIPKTGWHV